MAALRSATSATSATRDASPIRTDRSRRSARISATTSATKRSYCGRDIVSSAGTDIDTSVSRCMSSSAPITPSISGRCATHLRLEHAGECGARSTIVGQQQHVEQRARGPRIVRRLDTTRGQAADHRLRLRQARGARIADGMLRPRRVRRLSDASAGKSGQSCRRIRRRRLPLRPARNFPSQLGSIARIRTGSGGCVAIRPFMNSVDRLAEEHVAHFVGARVRQDASRSPSRRSSSARWRCRADCA